MKNISVQLQQFVVESLHPEALASQRFSLSDFDKWQQYIEKEIKEISVQVFRSTLRDRQKRIDYITGLFSQITELSNLVNGYLYKLSKIWNRHPSAKEIRQGYVSTCLAFEELLDTLAYRFPNVAESAKVTNYALNLVKLELKTQFVKTNAYFIDQHIEPELAAIVIRGLSDMINRRPLLRFQVVYLRKLMSIMVRRNYSSSTDLVEFLIVNDFNLPEFFLFCVATWMDELTKVDGLLEQKEMLLEVKSRLFDLSLTRGLKFPTTEHQLFLYNELNNFLSEKHVFVKERLKINRQFAAIEGQKPRAKRVLINLSVAQLGLFIRLQVEKGILAKEHIGELFAFFARNFYTPHTDFISPESLQKKSSDVEHATAVKLKAHLIAMLNWLNTNYNLSNYN